MKRSLHFSLFKPKKNFKGVRLDKYAVLTHKILELISERCPRALRAYMQIIAHINAQGNCGFSKEFITKKLHHSFATFRNDLRALAAQRLITWEEESKDKLAVTLTFPEVLNDGA